jgi:hypothetical protein
MLNDLEPGWRGRMLMVAAGVPPSLCWPGLLAQEIERRKSPVRVALHMEPYEGRRAAEACNMAFGSCPVRVAASVQGSWLARMPQKAAQPGVQEAPAR